MGIAMAGTLAAGLTTLPDGAGEVIFGVMTAWFAWRVYLDLRHRAAEPADSGHCRPHLLRSAAILYMFLALTTPMTASGGSGMSGMGGSSGAMTERYPAGGSIVAEAPTAGAGVAAAAVAAVAAAGEPQSARAGDAATEPGAVQNGQAAQPASASSRATARELLLAPGSGRELPDRDGDHHGSDADHHDLDTAIEGARARTSAAYEVTPRSTAPVTETTYHRPMASAWPVAWPGASSSRYRYSGHLL